MAPGARSSARVLLATLMICLGLSTESAQAANPRTLTCARCGLTLSYPPSWTARTAQSSAVPGTQSIFFYILRSPDGHTIFTTEVFPAQLTSSAVHGLAAREVRDLLSMPTTSQAPVAIAISQPGGSAAQMEETGVVKGQHTFAVARVVAFDGFLYVFGGSGPTPPSVATDAPEIALHTILASITLQHVHGHFTRPSAYLDFYYPLHWREVSSPALGKIVEDGQNGAVVFADAGRGAANLFDLRRILLENALLMGSIVGQPSFSNGLILVNGVPVQVVEVAIKDKQGHMLTAVVADASLNGFNYAFGGAAPSSSATLNLITDAIFTTSMQPPALPPDTGALRSFTGPNHLYGLRRPAAWVLGDLDSSVDATFYSRDGNLNMEVFRRTGGLASVLAAVSANVRQQGTVTSQTSTTLSLGTLSGQERVFHLTVVKGLTQESHIVAAASGNEVYVLTWSCYTNAPDAAKLLKLARQVQASFTTGR